MISSRQEMLELIKKTIRQVTPDEKRQLREALLQMLASGTGSRKETEFNSGKK
jgi:hypothetical protein